MDISSLTSPDLALLDRFRRTEFEAGGFGHEEHVRVAWIYLRCLPADEAFLRFIEDLRRLVIALGATDKYHETITWMYLLLIRERWERQEPAEWEKFAARNGDLLERGEALLQSYYRTETLRSDLARRVFLLPDRRG